MKYLWLFLLLLVSNSIVSQAELVTKKGSKYVYKDQVYKCKEMADIYKASPDALELYISGRSNVKAANTISYVGLGLVLGGGVLIAGSDNLSALIFGGLAILGGVVIEIVALIPRGVGNGKIRKALKTYNYEMIEKHGYKNDVSLSISQTVNGIGLVMHF